MKKQLTDEEKRHRMVMIMLIAAVVGFLIFSAVMYFRAEELSTHPCDLCEKNFGASCFPDPWKQY